MSEAENQQSAGGIHMEDHSGRSLGEQLRLKRKEKGVNITDVAHHLKLDPELLRAFEEERDPPHGLPEVYCKGFLRSYARYLGVEIQPGQVRAYRVSELQSEKDRPAFQSRRSLWPFILLAAVALFWLVSGGDLNGYKSLFTDEAGEEVEQTTAAPVAELPKAVPTVVEPVESVVEVENQEPIQAEETVESAEPKPVVAESEPAAEAVEQPDQTAETVTEEVAAEAPVLPAPIVPEPTVTQPTRGTVTIRYIDSSWTQVTDGLGRVLVKRTLDAGAVEDFEGPLPLKVNLGNAIGVRVQFNSQPFDHLNYIDDNNIAQFVLGGEE